jgi:hypothetical protein
MYLRSRSASNRPSVKASVAILGAIGPGEKYFDTSAFAAVNTARIGTAGFDILRGPGEKNLDVSLNREFSIRERYKLQVRADGFNVTNTPHFAAPNGSITSSGFGQITATVSNQREGQDSRTLRLGARLAF